MREGFYSVKWAVTQNRQQRYYKTGVEVTSAEAVFLKQNAASLSGRIRDRDLVDLWNQIYSDSPKSLVSRGRRALDQIKEYFSFDLFAKVVSGEFIPEHEEQYPTDLLIALRERGKRLENEDAIGSSKLFFSAATSFLRFAIHKGITTVKSPALPFAMITPKFLDEYERWMLKEGKGPQDKKDPEGKWMSRKGTPASISIVGIYCRNVRTLFNEAIEAGAIEPKAYPFKKYIIPQASNKKKALSSEVISQIFFYPCPEGSAMEFRRDLWIFSYLCNGMNFADMLSLKWKDVDLHANTIRFARAKTKRTKRENISDILIDLNERTIAVLDKWGTTPRKPNSYIFPFLEDPMTELDKKRRIKQVIKVNNAWMGKIAKRLGYPNLKLNTYEARHSFATMLIRSGAPMKFVSGKLDHGTVTTTERYIGTFEDEQTKAYMSALMPKRKADEEEK